MTPAGQLRHVITFQEKGEVVDEWGGPVPAWLDFAVDVRAKRSELSGRELIAAQAAQSEVTTEWTIRYLPGLKTSMRLVEGSVYYDIVSITDAEGMGRELVILTTSGMSEG